MERRRPGDRSTRYSRVDISKKLILEKAAEKLGMDEVGRG
jgi:hypothetical protein